MDIQILKSTPNGRMFGKRRISASLPKPNLPALKKHFNAKQVRVNTGKMSTYLTNQVCFIKKKDIFQYKIKNTAPITSSNSKILQGSKKATLRKYGKMNFQSTSIQQLSNLQVTTKSWCLYDLKSDKTLGFRQHYKREIASLTKIMTTLLSIEFIESFEISLSCKAKITRHSVSNQGTTASLQKNYWISLQDLLYGTMLPSGNDAAYMLAEYVGYLMYLFNVEEKGSEYYTKIEKLDLTQVSTLNYVKQFVGCMNERIRYMGLFNTQFSNPHGLSNALNVSTALDLIRVSMDASRNILFNTIMNTIQWKCILYQNDSFKKRIKRIWTNTNRLLEKDWEGIKTGITPTAGGCLSSLRDGVYIVVLNSSDAQTRFSDTEKIYQWYQSYKKKSQPQRFKLTHSLNLKQKTSILTSFCTIDNVETDVSD